MSVDGTATAVRGGWQRLAAPPLTVAVLALAVAWTGASPARLPWSTVVTVAVTSALLGLVTADPTGRTWEDATARVAPAVGAVLALVLGTGALTRAAGGDVTTLASDGARALTALAAGLLLGPLLLRPFAEGRPPD